MSTQSFKAYIEEYSAVYEPAEGGYYVPVSTVYEWAAFETIEAAREAIIELAREECATCKFFNNITYRGTDGDIHSAALNAEVGCDTGYIGEGMEVWVVAYDGSQPEDKVYEGYC